MKLFEEIIKPFLDEIERKDMPQVAGKDLEEMMAIFEENGIAYTSGDISVSRLKSTQEDYKPDKVKEMVANLKSNKMVLFPIVVSDDGFIMDGHHRWLAAKELYGEDTKIPAITIDLPKDEALSMFAKTSDKLSENLLTEDPDTVYDSEGDIKVEYEGGQEFPFGYNKSEAWIRDEFGFSNKQTNKRLDFAGKMRIGELGQTHGEIENLYTHYNEYAGNDRPDFKYAGRVFLDEKIISFWEYPEPEDLEKVLHDIENETKRIINKGMGDDVADIEFDDSWTIDVDVEDESDSYTGTQIPIKDYTGQTEKEKERAAAKAQAIQHALPPGDPRKEKRIAPAKRKRSGMTPTQYHQFICTSEGKTLADFLVDSLLTENPDYSKQSKEKQPWEMTKEDITEEVILDFLAATDVAKLIKEGSQAASGEVDDGPATFYRALSKYRDDVIPVAEQAGYVILDYIISKFHKDDFTTKFRYEVVPVVSFGSSGVGFTKADNPVAKYREHIAPIATSVGFEILDFLGVDLYDIQDGVEVKIPYQFKRDKMLSKYDKGQTFADDTLEESIKRKFNGVEFEFIYREHEVEPFFTVLRDGVPVDRMPANLSKEEMIAFARKNFSKWQADYVKSHGGFFTQIPQHGQTHGVWTGMEAKENLIDISVFLD